MRLQKTVVRGFRSRNHFSQQSEIVANFTTEYNARITEWEAMRPQAEGFEQNVSTQLEETQQAMYQCMTNVRSSITTAYETIISNIPTCEEFNSA